MSILSTELIAYASANMPEDDVSPYGGAINTGVKVTFTDIAATDNIVVYSSATGDITQVVTIHGRKADGTVIDVNLNVAGTGKISTSPSGYERLMAATINGAHVGTITVARDNNPTYDTIGTMEPGVTGIRRLFNKAFSSTTAKDYYEKIFIKNTNTSLALLGATISEVAGGGAALVDFCLESGDNGNASGANRLTAPASGATLSGLRVFDSNTKPVPGTDLASSGSVGVWVHLPLASGAAAQKNSYTLQIDGTST